MFIYDCVCVSSQISMPVWWQVFQQRSYRHMLPSYTGTTVWTLKTNMRWVSLSVSPPLSPSLSLFLSFSLSRSLSLTCVFTHSHAQWHSYTLIITSSHTLHRVSKRRIQSFQSMPPLKTAMNSKTDTSTSYPVSVCVWVSVCVCVFCIPYLPNSQHKVYIWFSSHVFLYETVASLYRPITQGS